MPTNDHRNTKTGSHQPEEYAFRAPNKAPARDTRDNPAPNPDGAAKGQAPMTPKPHSPSSDTKRKPTDLGEVPRTATSPPKFSTGCVPRRVFAIFESRGDFFARGRGGKHMRFRISPRSCAAHEHC